MKLSLCCKCLDGIQQLRFIHVLLMILFLSIFSFQWKILISNDSFSSKQYRIINQSRVSAGKSQVLNFGPAQYLAAIETAATGLDAAVVSKDTKLRLDNSNQATVSKKFIENQGFAKELKKDINNLNFNQTKPKRCTYIKDKDVRFPPWIDLSLRTVNVAVLLDKKLTQSVLNALNSLYTNSRATLHLYLVTCGLSKDELFSFLDCYHINNFTTNKRVHFVQFNESWLGEVNFGTFSQLTRSKRAAHLVTCGNYMRFFLQRMLPDVDKLIYMDTDMIVQGDIAELDYYAENLTLSLAVTKRRNKDFSLRDAFPPDIKSLYENKFKGELFHWNTTSFCNGIFVANLWKWRRDEDTILSRLNYWMSVAVTQNQTQTLPRWWERPTQSLMQLIFNGDYSWIPDRNWHSEGLGYIRTLCDDHLQKAKLLHWNGPNKPWVKNVYRSYWNVYTPTACSGSGKCIRHKTNIKYQCVCDQYYSGSRCQHSGAEA